MKNIGSIALISLLFGCGSKEDSGEIDDIACTASIEFSVYATIYNEAGEVIENASVSYSAEAMSGDCEVDSIGGHYCGEEQSGEVTILVSAEGYVDAEETVTVGADQCHVITENLDITMTAVAD